MNSKLTHRPIAQLSLILLPLFLTFGTKSAIAQITPAKDGTGTVVQTQNNQLNISGGTQAGNNQFHSFQQFGVNAGQTANFLSNPNVANILGRVTGGDASLINGMLKVSGSNANLYLMNPAGIVFGKDASLNLPAAFTATTANGIGFGTGNWFNAIGSNNYATLTSNPTSFGFSGLSGSIVNAGNLSVNPGQSIALVGGTVVNTGTIAAPGGNITIAAIPGGKMVRIGQDGMVLSLDLPTSDRALINAPITTPLSLPALLTGGSIPSAMGVVVEDGVIRLTGGSASVSGSINADGKGLQSGGNVVAYADNHLSFGGTIAAKGGELGGNGGFVDTSGKGTIAISPNAKVLTTAAKGLTGTWLIDPADLEVVAGMGGTIGGAGSTIGAGTIVSALNGTNVNLQADNSITVNAAIDASLNANAGNLTLTAPTANLNQTIVLKTGSTLSGTATTVNVGAAGKVQNGVDVSAAGGTVNLAAATYTLANTVAINKDVTVRGTGAGTTTVSGNNAVRVFNIGSGTVTLDGMSIVNGRVNGQGGSGLGGGIYSYGTLTVSNSTLSGNFAGVGGGGIFNDNGTLIVSNSNLSGNSVPFGGSNNNAQPGGGIYNYAGGTLTVSNSNLSGNSALFGGGIFNNAGGTLMVSNSTLSGNSAVGGGGIYSLGTSTVSNSTLSGNSSGGGAGGGIYSGSGTLTVSNSTLSGNSSQSGGGIFNNSGTLAISNSTLSGNSAQVYGGGIYSSGAVTIGNSTFSGNSSQSGGGIYNIGSMLTIGNSTLSGNSAQFYGGGIYKLIGSVTIGNSIVSGNTAPMGAEISLNNGSDETFTSQGYNLLGYGSNAGLWNVTAAVTDITPTAALSSLLAPLGDYGGPTKTHALLPGSAAINAGNAATTTLDQRGKTRVGTADIGAFESQGFTIAATGVAIQSNTVNSIFATPITATVTANNVIEPVAGGTVTYIAPSFGATITAGIRTATIDALGNANLTPTATTTAGTYTALAETLGATGTAIFNLTNTPDVPFSIAATGGTSQNAVVKTPYAQTLQVRVLDQFNNVIPGATVSFSVPGSGASGVLGTTTATTDTSGNATIAIKANTKAGLFTAKGGVAGVTGTADFALTNLADVAKNITTTSGSDQTTVVDTNFANNLVATVTDQFGNPIVNSTVTFTVPGTGASGIFTINTATTDANGSATIALKANTKAGLFTAQGSTANVTGTADFALTNLADVAKNIATTSGSGQSTVVDTNFANNLVATVTDKFGNPIVNSTVTFTVPGTGASGIFTTNAATTNANGVATIAIKANTKAGLFTAQGGVTGVTGTADFALTNLADVAKNITTTSGSGQSTVVDTNFANNLVATVTDKFGNPIVNSTVTFTVPGTGASGIFTTNTATTDGSGKATIAIKANTKAGLFIAQGGVTGVTGTADFALTNLADVAKNITTTSGSGQSTVVDNNFANNLVATVTDKFGNPIVNSTVTFTVPGTGASGVFVTNTANTDANGVATIAIKANIKAGTFTAQGSTTNVTGTADFALTNLADVANKIETTAGSGQQITVDKNFTDNLVVTVKDKFDNLVSNATVTFSATTGTNNSSGIFTTNTATTGVDGKATIALKANPKAGAFTAQGGVTGVTGTADFALTNLADVANSVTTTSGSNQTTTVNTNFANNLVATVTDKFGNPIENSTVTFTVPGSGASGSTNNTVQTNVNGIATIVLKANTKAGAFTAKGNVTGVNGTADYALTNSPDRPANLVVLTQPQTTIVAQRFTQALRTQILDQFGNPVPNTSVTFILPSRGASGQFSNGTTQMTLTTDSQGIATLTLIANNVPGTYTAIAQIQLPNRLETTPFTLTNTLKTGATSI